MPAEHLDGMASLIARSKATEIHSGRDVQDLVRGDFTVQWVLSFTSRVHGGFQAL
jgi:hypothetical protein